MTEFTLRRTEHDAERSSVRPNFAESLAHAARGTLVCVCWLILPACTWTSTDGTHHTIVIGLAIISSKTVGVNSAIATRSNLAGLSVQTGSHPGFTLGLQSIQLTEIGPKWHGILIVTSKPGAPLEMSALPVNIGTKHSAQDDSIK